MRALSAVCLAIVIAGAAEAENPDLGRLARRVVTTSASIKPGEVVVVDGGDQTLPWMEALAIEAQKAGGLVTILLESGRVRRSFIADVPEEYMEQKPAHLVEWLKHVNVWIATTAPGVKVTDISANRRAKAARADDLLYEMLMQSKARLLFIHGYPSEEQARTLRLGYAAYERLYWRMLDVDYGEISKKGARLKQLLEGAQAVRVTSPDGTDFTFAVGNRPVSVGDGVANEQKAKGTTFGTRIAHLPGGHISLAPIETSANGRVVAAPDTCRHPPFIPFRGVSFEFKKGRLENFNAETGAECFQELTGPYMPGLLSIGLNPALTGTDEGGLRYLAAGMIRINIRYDQSASGSNKSQASYYFLIMKATVEADGEVILKDGQLTF